jgi:MoxR-like ATPase
LLGAVLVENAIVLLTGTYGTGKTQLIQIIRRLFFSDGKGGHDFDWESCHQELTAFDVLYHLDLAELQRGREVVHPKKMISARFKFLNEIQRANTAFFNALLPLLAERRVTYRDIEWRTPEFVCFMDRNPLDSASSELPQAFADRIDFNFDIPAIHLEEHLRVLELRRRQDGFLWTGLDQLAEPALTFPQLFDVWQDVKRIDITRRSALLAGMISDAFRLCVATERSTARMEFDLPCVDCQFKGEVCSHLLKVPGQRFTNSLLRLAQALAWLDGRTEVGEEDLYQALPWCISHRLSLRPEELRKLPSEQTWVQEVAVGQILTPRRMYWGRALAALEGRDEAELEKLGLNDLVVRELQLLLQASSS